MRAQGTFLRTHGESPMADLWERLDQLRQGGWYGTRTDPLAMQTALSIVQDIRAWAIS